MAQHGVVVVRARHGDDLAAPGGGDRRSLRQQEIVCKLAHVTARVAVGLKHRVRGADRVRQVVGRLRRRAKYGLREAGLPLRWRLWRRRRSGRAGAATLR